MWEWNEKCFVVCCCHQRGSKNKRIGHFEHSPSYCQIFEASKLLVSWLYTELKLGKAPSLASEAAHKLLKATWANCLSETEAEGAPHIEQLRSLVVELAELVPRTLRALNTASGFRCPYTVRQSGRYTRVRGTDSEIQLAAYIYLDNRTEIRSSWHLLGGKLFSGLDNKGRSYWYLPRVNKCLCGYCFQEAKRRSARSERSYGILWYLTAVP